MSRRIAYRRWLGVTAAVGLSAACPGPDVPISGSDSASSSHSGSASTAAAATAGPSTVVSAGAGGSGGCDAAPQYPAPLPGWLPYTDWQCNGCRIYYPESAAALPPPIAWEKCAKSPAGIDCQKMVIDWSPALNAFGGGLMDQSSGVLFYGRNYPGYIMDVIAELDGKVRTAMLTMRPNDVTLGCVFGGYAFNQGKAIYKVLGAEAYGKWASSPHKGAVGGAIDDLHPKVLGDFGQEDSWGCSSSRVFRLTRVSPF